MKQHVIGDMDWPAGLPRIPSASDLDVCASCEHFWKHSSWVEQDQDHCEPMLLTDDAFRRLSPLDLDRYVAVVKSGARCCFYAPLTADTASRWRGPLGYRIGVALRVPIVPESEEPRG